MAELRPVDRGIEETGRGEVAQLAEVLAKAFYDDPILSWMLPDPATRAGRLRRFYAIETGRLTLPNPTFWPLEPFWLRPIKLSSTVEFPD